MKILTKAFENTSSEGLSRSINRWLKDEEIKGNTIEIIDIKYVSTSAAASFGIVTYYSAIVIYRTSEVSIDEIL